MMHPNHVRIEETLESFGGLYTFADLIDLIERGEMQSFAEGDSWVVTQICEFPRRRVLSVEFAVGSLDELRLIEPRVEEFAKKHDISLITANGRLGFDLVKSHGWKRVSATYVKELGNGS